MGGDFSSTRLAPLFQELTSRSGNWLDRLLTLPRVKLKEQVKQVPSLGAVKETCFHPNEKTLAPPRALLEHLIEHAEKYSSTKRGGYPHTHSKWNALAQGDKATKDEALRLLGQSGGAWPAPWWVLEEPVQVDVFLRTEKAIVLVQGFGKGEKPKTRSEWMPVRHHLWCAMDNAKTAFPNLPIFGLYVVEEEEEGELSLPWWGLLANEVNPHVLLASLPHLSTQEQVRLLLGFLGATTYRAVCAEFRLEPHQD